MVPHRLLPQGEKVAEGRMRGPLRRLFSPAYLATRENTVTGPLRSATMGSP